MIGKLIIISAPSGAGKSTLVEHMLLQFKGDSPLIRVLTYTTRAARAGEIHGQDFYYITQGEFELKITQGFFIEWSNAYGHYYGTPRSVLHNIEKGVSCMLIADRAGARQIKELIPEVVLIWIYTTSIDVLHKRLLTRGTNTTEQIERRLRLARDEIEQEDAHPLYQHHILNDDFYEAFHKMHQILLQLLHN